MKTIKFDISIPIQGLQKGKKFTVQVDDNATIIEALAMVDKLDRENPHESIFPIYDGYIHNYLQLFINLEDEYVYDDVGLNAYGPDKDGIMRRFNPIRENVGFNLYPDSLIQLQPDVGC
jgi:hypothetical protein